jgi:hypothetical protein
MQWVLWGFGGLLAVVLVIIGVAARVAMRGAGNGAGLRRRRTTTPRSDPRRGVPKSR